MIHAGEINDIMAVKDNLTPQFFHILFNLVMLHHDNNEIATINELI